MRCYPPLQSIFLSKSPSPIFPMKSRIFRIITASVMSPLLFGAVAFAEEATETTTPSEETTTTESPLPTLTQEQEDDLEEAIVRELKAALRNEAKKGHKKEAFVEKMKGINAESKEQRKAAREKCKEEKTTIRKGFVEQVQTLTGKENKEARKTLKTTTKESLKTTREGCKEERKTIRETTKVKRRTTKTELKDKKKALKEEESDDTGTGASVLQSVRVRMMKIRSGKAAFRENIRAVNLGGVMRRTEKPVSARTAAAMVKKRENREKHSVKKVVPPIE